MPKKIKEFTGGEFFGFNTPRGLIITKKQADKLNEIRDTLESFLDLRSSGRAKFSSSGSAPKLHVDDEFPVTFLAKLKSNTNPYTTWVATDKDGNELGATIDSRASAIEYNLKDGLLNELVLMEWWGGDVFRFQHKTQGNEGDPGNPCPGLSVNVTVRNGKNFDRIEGVVITARDESDGTLSNPCSTDSNGACDVALNSPGDYTVLWEYDWGAATCSGEVPLNIPTCQNPEVHLSLCCGKTCVNYFDFDTGAPLSPEFFVDGVFQEGPGRFCRLWSTSTGNFDLPTSPGTATLPGYWDACDLEPPATVGCFEVVEGDVAMYNKDCWVSLGASCTHGRPTRDGKVIPKELTIIPRGGGTFQYDGQQIKLSFADPLGNYNWDTGGISGPMYWFSGCLPPLDIDIFCFDGIPEKGDAWVAFVEVHNSLTADILFSNLSEKSNGFKPFPFCPGLRPTIIPSSGYDPCLGLCRAWPLTSYLHRTGNCTTAGTDFFGAANTAKNGTSSWGPWNHDDILLFAITRPYPPCDQIPGASGTLGFNGVDHCVQIGCLIEDCNIDQTTFDIMEEPCGGGGPITPPDPPPQGFSGMGLPPGFDVLSIPIDPPSIPPSEFPTGGDPTPP